MLSGHDGQVDHRQYKRFLKSNHPFLFLLAELSLSSLHTIPNDLERIPDVRYYANREGEITPIIAGSFPPVVVDHLFYLGVLIDGRAHPIFDVHGRWIFVQLLTGQIVIVTPELYHFYGYIYPPEIIARLQNHNNVAFFMTRRLRIEPRNRRQR